MVLLDTLVFSALGYGLLRKTYTYYWRPQKASQAIKEPKPLTLRVEPQTGHIQYSFEMTLPDNMQAQSWVYRINNQKEDTRRAWFFTDTLCDYKTNTRYKKLLQSQLQQHIRYYFLLNSKFMKPETINRLVCKEVIDDTGSLLLSFQSNPISGQESGKNKQTVSMVDLFDCRRNFLLFGRRSEDTKQSKRCGFVIPNVFEKQSPRYLFAPYPREDYFISEQQYLLRMIQEGEIVQIWQTFENSPFYRPIETILASPTQGLNLRCDIHSRNGKRQAAIMSRGQEYFPLYSLPY